MPGLVIIEQGNSGPSGARNTGIAAASHPHLAFTDDDCLVEPGWIRDLHAALLQRPTALVGGQTFNRLRHNLFSEASQLVVDAFCHWQNKDPENGRFIPSNNMACCRAQIMALGGFDTHFTLAASEDREICNRWRQAGWPIVQLENRALVGHSHWLDHCGFWRQQVNYGRGAHINSNFYGRICWLVAKMCMLYCPSFVAALLPLCLDPARSQEILSRVTGSASRSVVVPIRLLASSAG